MTDESASGSGSPPDRLEEGALELLRTIAFRAETARRLVGESTEAVLRSIVEAAVALFRAEAASIALYDPMADRLVIRVAAGPQGAGAIGLSLAPSTGLAGYVFTTGQAIAQSDVAHDRRFGREAAERTGYTPRSLVAVPLVDEHGTIGVLEVLDKLDSETFSIRDIELASVFAHQAAVAISASRVERDTTAMLAAALRSLAATGEPSGGAGTEAADDEIERIASSATRALDGEDDRLWELVDQVARVRTADPEQLALVSDLIGVLARHAAATRRRPGVTSSRG